MKFFSLILFLVLFSLKVLGAEIQAELQLTSAPAVLQEGDLVEAVLKVWPIENVDLNEFKQLDNMVLANALIVTAVESVGPSLNNADVVEAKLLLIVKRSQENPSSALNYKGQLISVVIPPLKIEAADKDPEDYYVMDQGLIASDLLKVVVALACFILMLLLFWKRKIIKSLIQKFKSNPVAAATKKYKEMFLQAATRQDYERIYALRNDWLQLIVVQAPAYKEFFSKMEQHQYKKSWNNEELSEVQNCFDVIRGSFK